ncbi:MULTISPECIES: hypothetical protein [Rhodopseudomonas]|uniref:Uncharacterized protein n=1 Tax=Rhodopseudomonas palustris TaxID=1076 RepID=A0A0D7E1X1_RHOPL|nr:MULTISPECIES: hypothetical protein [Rhodopseudomonas]KIZ33657.1 hypothetical protein OO17_28225 [Rhodopseudomonas palustris]MDF3810424.1 hypothetical protein [Rhodopseudomonas sp. BAL398]WOK19596.1 hypothetical protein RBJ75_08795 [Rhodopseudomonas sp. BAL398]
MSAIATNPTKPAATSLPAIIAGTASTPTTGTKPANATAGQPTDSVELSDRAKAILAKSAADKAATADLSLTFDEILQKRSDALSSKLTKAFQGLNVNLDEAVRLQVDKFGNVTTEGPWKKKIEKLFADDPELAKEFKAVAGLNALKAANTALELYNKEKGSVAGSKEQQQAWTQYNIRSINIQTLSGVMSLKDGSLRSAAVDYIDTIAKPHGDGSVASQKDIANRLA